MYSARDIASWVGGRIVNESALERRVESIQLERPTSLPSRGEKDLCFFFSKDYEKDLRESEPGALITADPFVIPLEKSGLGIWKRTAVISCPDPYLAMALLSERFIEKFSSVAHLGRSAKGGRSEIHASAVIDPSASLGENVRIGAHCVIEKDARIGSGTVIYPGCYVGPGVVIGKDCAIFPGVKIYEQVRIGNRVRLHGGAVIGADGFGYAPKKEGGRVTGHQKIWHLGGVVIEDDVEIGANTCVDRGTLADTVIRREAKIDNQVQVGHNAQIGEGTVICGCVAVAGGTKIGRFVYIGGVAGITKVEIGDGAQVGACSLVTKDIPPGSIVAGDPQRNHKDHFKLHAMLNRMLQDRSRPERKK